MDNKAGCPTFRGCGIELWITGLIGGCVGTSATDIAMSMKTFALKPEGVPDPFTE
jgi:hypothetical protein